MVGLQFGPLGRVGLVHVAGLPCPSGELGHVTWAKARATWFLKWRAPREAGFTEQRKPPAHDGGRMTSQRTTDPYCLVGRPWLNNHLFVFASCLYSPWALKLFSPGRPICSGLIINRSPIFYFLWEFSLHSLSFIYFFDQVNLLIGFFTLFLF